MMRIGFALVAGRSQIVIINISPGVTEIPSNIDRSSNRYNLGSRWAIEDPKKRKIIRIWCPRWWSHQIRSSSEGIVTQGLYSYLKNNFWVQKMQFRRFLKKPPAATFFVNWFRKWLPRPFQRCRNRQWYILFHLNFILHHCGPCWPAQTQWTGALLWTRLWSSGQEKNLGTTLSDQEELLNWTSQLPHFSTSLTGTLLMFRSPVSPALSPPLRSWASRPHPTTRRSSPATPNLQRGDTSY